MEDRWLAQAGPVSRSPWGRANAPGNTYGGSRPGAAECTLVDELNQRDGDGWIKGHLWNDNLGGHGVSINLTPMMNSTNPNLNRRFEEPLKAMLLACTRHTRRTTREHPSGTA
ncbi:hypothetical protein [Streptomyces huasconensis]|uniref:hypothetical protein n=1 Tax=Streptomyces huasconensis TaxID=1854574 RepID=UPI0033D68187